MVAAAVVDALRTGTVEAVEDAGAMVADALGIGHDGSGDRASKLIAASAGMVAELLNRLEAYDPDFVETFTSEAYSRGLAAVLDD